MRPMRVQAPTNNLKPRLFVLIAFMFGHFNHHLSTAAMVPLLPMIRDSLELDYLRSGLLLSAFSLSYGFAQLPVAIAADRISKRYVVSLGLIVTGIACILAGLSGDYIQILSSFVLLGMAGSTYHAPSAAFLAQTFGKDTRGRSLGIHTMGGTSGLMAAPVVSILIASVTGSWRTSFIIMWIPVIVAGMLVWAVSRSQETANKKSASQESACAFKLSELLRALGLLVIIAMVTQLLSSAMNSFLPLYLVDKHGVAAEHAGLIMTIVYAAGVIGGPIGGAISDRIGRKPVILLSVMVIGPMMFLVTVLPFGLLLIGATIVYGMFLVFRLPAIESLIADLVPVQQRATVLGGYFLLAQETQGISTPILGWLMDEFGINDGFVYLATVALACSAIVLLIRRRV